MTFEWESHPIGQLANNQSPNWLQATVLKWFIHNICVYLTTTKTTVSQSTTSTTTATTSTTASVPPSTTTTTTQQSNVVTRCHASQLSFSYSEYVLLSSEQENVIFRYTNTSNVTCILYGYPGIEFYTANGQPIIAKTDRTGGYPIAYDPGPNLVTLTPGANAYFYTAWRTVSASNGITQGCAVPSSVKSYPPNSYTQLSLTFQHPTNDQLIWVGATDICNLSTNGLRVSAVAPGSVYLQNAPWMSPSVFAPGSFLP